MINVEFEFFKSALTSTGHEGELDDVLKWIARQNQAVSVSVETMPIADLAHWEINQSTGSLCHDSGHFFSIDGIRVRTNSGSIPVWDQPIINQPEIGYLGIISKKIDGALHFLLQAKVEPGNISCVQLSPTLQATRSNYSQVHGGVKPLYLEYFQKVESSNILLDQLQSEQGARFLIKRNRNMIIYVADDVQKHENFIWLTLYQIKKLMQYDNLINMDTRTIVSGIQYGNANQQSAEMIQFLISHNAGSINKNSIASSVLGLDGSTNNLTNIFHFLTKIKSKFDLSVEKIPLNQVKDWHISKNEIFRDDGKYFKIIGVNVAIGNREVITWQQPMVKPSQIGICGFVGKLINGTLHFIVQGKVECGNRDIIEFAPTVQCLIGNYRDPDSNPVPFLDYLLNASEESIIHDSLQSEEGGRFYHEQNHNRIVLADASFSENLPDNYIWMTLSQLNFFNRFNNYVNIQARSLLASIELAS